MRHVSRLPIDPIVELLCEIDRRHTQRDSEDGPSDEPRDHEEESDE